MQGSEKKQSVIEFLGDVFLLRLSVSWKTDRKFGFSMDKRLCSNAGFAFISA
jgi:hypothetical protein